MSETTAEVGLKRKTFDPLPLGHVRPTGWLREQTRIQADGLSGHLDEFWPDIAESGWIGGEAEGWERGPYWLDGIVPLAFLLDDETLKGKVQRWVDRILEDQHEDGWLGSVLDKRITNPKDLRPGRAPYSYELDPWPRYILLKALIQFHEATGDERIIPAMVRFLRRLDQLLDERHLRAWARYRWADLVVSVHWLYERTEEPWLLGLAAKAAEQGYDWQSLFARYPYRWRIVREERDLTTHVVNNAMAVKTSGVWYRQSGDPENRNAVYHMIDQLDQYHGQANGMFSGDEHLAGRNPSQGTELCAVVEYMYSLETLIAILGNVQLADRLERIAYNALPATFSPDMWVHQYVQQVNQVVCRVDEDRIYTSNGPDANIFGLEPNFGCCTADMHQGWPKLASHLWMRSPDDGLSAVAYAPCTVSTEVEDVSVNIAVETEYPFDGQVRIVVEAEQSVRFPLHLRIPEWAEGARIQVGDSDLTTVEAGGFHRLEREWDSKTIVALQLPMRARIERRDNGSVSMYRGPLLFALPVGEDWRQVGGEAPHADWEIYPTTPWNYALDVDVANPEADVSFVSDHVSTMPFSPDSAPVSAKVQGSRLPEWEIEHNAAAVVPQSPVKTGEPRKELKLIPFGATNLRVAQFPVLATGSSPEE